jgi:hypothetical protein
LIPARTIYLAATAIFGLVHEFGTRAGIAGVLLAGFLD